MNFLDWVLGWDLRQWSRVWLLCIVVGAIGGGCTRQVFGAEIKAPTQAQPHALVRVTSTTDGVGFAWFVAGPQGFAETQAYDGGKSCVFTGPPGRYAVMLVVAGAGGNLDQGQAIVTIGDPPPPPPGPGPSPGPQPGPAPAPIFNGRLQLDALAYSAAANVPAAARVKATAMAANYEAISAKLAAGGLRDVPAALEELRTLNRATLGADATAWAPFANAWSEAANKLNASGSLRSAADYVEAFSETAAGLRAVR